MAEPVRLDARAVASAAGSVVGRLLGGIALGLGFGVAAFAIERGMGWLDGEGWRALVGWLMLPLYGLGGAAAFGFAFTIGGIRRAAARLLVDSGVLRRMVERAQAKLPEDTGEEGPPREWLGRTIHGLGRRLATQLRASGTADAIELIAREKIDEWYELPVYLAWGALVVLVVVPPLVL